jgi:cobalt/nickel transport system ATP-binding protein
MSGRNDYTYRDGDTMENLIEVECLKHIYPDKTEVSVCGLHFTAKEGERVTILGPNGAGKTTLLFHILGLLKPVEGKVSVMGMEPFKQFNELRKHVGVVFQNVDEQIIGPRVYDDIAFTPRSEGYSKEKVDDMTKNISQSLGIEGLLNKIPHYLSSGQKKKVALAGALVMKPKLLILDEPFDSLDSKSKTEMIAILNSINKEHGTTIITTTHDINIVPYIADTIYILNNGSIVAKGNPQEVFSQSDLLKDANLETPILSELFSRLRDRGFEVSIPYTLDDAELNILKIIEKL